jgi:hypothetical protein
MTIIVLAILVLLATLLASDSRDGRDWTSQPPR